jgi:large subunit ribosomal protein L23
MSGNSELYQLLKKPIITEKSTALQEYNQYVFEVPREANKIEIKKAVELAFPGRKVEKVRTMNSKSTTRRFKRTIGRTKATKKAVVSIIGEPIELITGA